MSSTDTRGSRGWKTAGSGGTRTRAIAQIRVGDTGDHLGGSGFSLRGQRTGWVRADVPRRRTPLRAGGRRWPDSRDDLQIRGRTGWPEGLAGVRQRLAGPVPADADRRRGRDDRLRLLSRRRAARAALHADEGRGLREWARDRRALCPRAPVTRPAARRLAGPAADDRRPGV